MHPVGEQAVHDLVDRAVAAERHNDIRAVAHGSTGERCGVPAVLRLDGFEVRIAGHGAGENVPFARGRRRRARVRDDEDAHGGEDNASPTLANVANDAADAKPRPESRRVPGPVRVAVIIIAAECLALVAAAIVLIAKSISGTPGDLGRAVITAVIAVVGAVALGIGARALLRLRPAARSPIVVLQLLALPVAYSLAFQAGRIGYGAPIMLAALAVIFLLFTPPAREALDRDPPT
jgi:hypothetical protein